MDAESAWQATLRQLQMEMPRASFDTWVRDTRFLSLDEEIFKVGVRNDYARDWLDNRLLSTVDRMLAGMLNQSVSVHFVVDNRVGEDAGEEDSKSNDNSRAAQIATGCQPASAAHADLSADRSRGVEWTQYVVGRRGVAGMERLGVASSAAGSPGLG